MTERERLHRLIDGMGDAEVSWLLENIEGGLPMGGWGKASVPKPDAPHSYQDLVQVLGQELENL